MKNLFDYATKELSQDAFLRWLFENYNCKNNTVKKACEKLLGSLLGLEDFNIEKVSDLKTYSQWKKVDILIRFKYDDLAFCLAIEDKTFSEEHEQLENYNNSLQEYTEWLKDYYKCFTVVRKNIYYKTAKLSPEEIVRVENQKWEIFDIDKIYKVFHLYGNTGNDILDDYITHITTIYLACHTTEKPSLSESNIDFLKWTSYFNNVIVPKLSQKGYQADVWKAGQYPYICLSIKKHGFLEKSPFVEIRSRDCLDNNFVARILLYGVERNEVKFSKLKQRIINTETTIFIPQNYKQQIGETKKNLKSKTDDEFVSLVEKCAEEFLDIMKDWQQ